MTDQVVLEGVGLRKRFGGITAISELDIALRNGCITGLVGPNPVPQRMISSPGAAGTVLSPAMAPFFTASVKF